MSAAMVELGTPSDQFAAVSQLPFAAEFQSVLCSAPVMISVTVSSAAKKVASALGRANVQPSAPEPVPVLSCPLGAVIEVVSACSRSDCVAAGTAPSPERTADASETATLWL